MYCAQDLSSCHPLDACIKLPERIHTTFTLPTTPIITPQEPHISRQLPNQLFPPTLAARPAPLPSQNKQTKTSHSTNIRFIFTVTELIRFPISRTRRAINFLAEGAVSRCGARGFRAWAA